MINRIQRRLHKLALASLVTAGSSIASFVSADTFDCGSHVVPVHPLVTVPSLALTPYSPDGVAPVQTLVTSQSSSAGRSALQSTACREMARTEELCGWVNMAEVLPAPTPATDDFAAEDFATEDFAAAFAKSLAGSWQNDAADTTPIAPQGWAGGFSTHDSCPIDVRRMIYSDIVTNHAKPQSSPSPSPSPQLTSAGIAASLVAATGVKVHQFAEPFAMVGPSIADSLASVRLLQNWYAGLVDSAESLRMADEAKLRADIDALAMEEPIDASGFVGSGFVGPIQPPAQPSIVVEDLNPLVGGSPIVMTIRVEEYLAYDLAPRDMMVWALPSMRRTFCIREQLDRAAQAAMWNEADNEIAAGSLWQSTADLVQSSPECLMDDLLCRVHAATHSVDFIALSQPRSIGRSIGSLVRSSTRAAGETFRSIAVRMPKSDAPADRPVVKRIATQNTCTMR